MKQPNNPWQVATIIGSVWGAFEVVAGSLLHNLAIPMAAGTILSAMGVMIMVTGARVFGGKGIFWRSALVCAALKTVSPSPVILSPMIGITLEGVLLEAGVVMLGNNLAGYLLGGGLAVLSILGFKLVRLIMIYGTDLVEAYKSVFSFAFSNEFLASKGYIVPIAILVILYLALGAFAAFTGYRGGKAIKERFSKKNIQIIPPNNQYKPSNIQGYKGGIGFLIFHIIWLFAFIFSKNYIPTLFWISGGIVYFLLCLFRYGRVRKLISKPAFWVVIIVVASTSSLFIMLGKNGAISFSYELLEQAVTILVRASVVIISFTSISIEMMSKGVTRHFMGGMFSPLAKSYVNAYGSLPHLISRLKSSGASVLKPMPLIEGMFSQFTEQHHTNKSTPNIIIVTGDRHTGKTTFIKEMVAHLENHHVPLAGFYAQGHWENNQRSGFTLTILPNHTTIELCNRTSKSWQQFGVFHFNPTAIDAGINALNNAPEGALVVVDEIGLFELEGKLWANAFERILSEKKHSIVVSIRQSFLEQAKDKWDFSGALAVDATADCPEKIAQLFLK